MKRCTKCILPENFPNIKFNNEGVCNYCHGYSSVGYIGRVALRNLLRSYRHKGNKYDLIVPISGGKDSTFVLYQTIKEFEMRVLALNYDNGFAAKQAQENVKRTVEILGVDFVSLKSRRDIQKKCLRDNILTWALHPSSEAFPTLCYGCKEGYLNGARKIAGALKIPLVVLGDSTMENSQFKDYLGYVHRSYVVHLLRRYFLKNPFYLNPKNIYHYFLLNAEFSLPASFYRFSLSNAPRVIHWFDYEEYDEQKTLATITDKLEWKKPENSVSSWRFDCQIHAIVDFMFLKKLGFTEKDELYSKMIREGTMSRAEALERIELEKQNESMRSIMMNEVFKKLGLSSTESRLCISRLNQRLTQNL